MKIHIMGASCAGSTTLGQALSNQTSAPYFDTDAYFWADSEIPFTLKRDPQLRNEMLKQDLAGHQNWILGGSMVNWGGEWLNAFDLVVFLYIPRAIRIQRLKDRELERYGDRHLTDPVYKIVHQDFMEWAWGYDDNTTKGRTLKVHQDWLEQVSCPVLEIRGDTTVQERLGLILPKLYLPEI